MSDNRQADPEAVRTAAVSGANGLVGSGLVPFLLARKIKARRLARPTPAIRENDIYFNPATGQIEDHKLNGIDAVIHLGGHSVASGRWTSARKGLIRGSRVESTALLARTLAKLDKPPRVFICASAVGLYGDRGEELLYEESPAGRGFLAEVGQAWEDACRPAVERGIRVVNLRIGVVLSAKGGMLKRVLPVFRMGLGGRLGSGTQYMSWIDLSDLVRVIGFVLDNRSLAGPVNACTAFPVTNSAFSSTLAAELRRPARLPAPAWALKLVLGEMSELLLSSQRVVPRKLMDHGFTFNYPTLPAALRHCLRES